ncbi:hypothetical protein U3249_004796 [Salmonella enterica]|nr:hypothetical protein [Salmonella enterica]
MSSRRSAIPSDSLLQLRQRLDRLPPKSPERANQIAATAQLYGISVTTVYRALHLVLKPRTAHRSDHGQPRILPPSELEHYCELIAALKLRTTNKSGRHLSTGRAIQLLEEHGVGEKHSRLEDWLANIGQEGVRDMCSWEQYCRFAREPESRKVGVDARITIDGTAWEVEPDMAGETVILLWGLFDEEMYVEFTGETWGPYYPVSGPVPLHRYRTFRRGKAAERADRIHALARQLNIPISALSGSDLRVVSDDTQQRIDALPHQPFDTRKFEYHFPTVIAAKLAIADDLAIPLARMSDEDRAFIDSILTETLNRSEVLARIRDYFRSRQSGEDHAG